MSQASACTSARHGKMYIKIERRLIMQDLLWKFQIVALKGGQFMIACSEDDINAEIKMKQFYSKGHVSKPKLSNGIWSCEVVSDKFLTLAFKQKR